MPPALNRTGWLDENRLARNPLHRRAFNHNCTFGTGTSHSAHLMEIISNLEDTLRTVQLGPYERPKFEERLENSKKEFDQIQTDVMRAASFAVVAMAPEAVAVLDNFNRDVSELANSRELAEYLHVMLEKLTGIATADLGMRADFGLPSRDQGATPHSKGE